MRARVARLLRRVANRLDPHPPIRLDLGDSGLGYISQMLLTEDVTFHDATDEIDAALADPEKAAKVEAVFAEVDPQGARAPDERERR